MIKVSFLQNPAVGEVKVNAMAFKYKFTLVTNSMKMDPVVKGGVVLCKRHSLYSGFNLELRKKVEQL